MMNGMRLKAAAALLAAVAAVACSGSNAFTGPGSSGGGGSQAGSIQGTVTAGGAGVSNIVVVVVGGDSARTSSTGRYVISDVGAATYAVSIRVPLNYDLAPGQQSTQTVTVPTGGSAVANWTLTQNTTTP